MSGLEEAEQTAKETVIMPILFFAIAVLLQSLKVFGFSQDYYDDLFKNLFIVNLIILFIMGLARNVWYLLGIIVGTFVLGMIYSNIEEDVVIYGISFKESINPITSILQIVVWILGLILRIILEKYFY